MNFLRTFFASLLGTITAFIVGGILFFMVIGGIASAVGSDEGAGTMIQDNSILSLKLDLPILDNTPGTEDFQVSLGLDPESVKLMDLITAIELAKTNDKIKGIHLRSDYLMTGWSQVKTIRDALESFKSSGKFVTAYGDFYTQMGYYLASVSDSIYVNPNGGVELKGLASEVLYYKDFEDEYGFKMEVIRHGKYKSAVEPYLSNTMSKDNREQLGVLISSLWETISSEISESRNISVQRLDEIATNLEANLVENAFKIGVIDQISYKSDYINILKSRLGLEPSDRLKLVSYEDLLAGNAARIKGVRDQIAIIYAQGPILFGEGNETQIGDKNFVKAIEDAAKSKRVKAIVLRVDSPGGSALISDILWKALDEAKKKKPLVVSMGNVAASGGYYIACGADKIFADPMTITGSIGVFATLPNFKGFADNIGINAEHVLTHKNALGYSPFEPLSEGFRKSAREGIEFVYETFKRRVSEGRNISLEDVEAIAQGRVWTGVQAKENGLIDELGSINDALDAAASLAEIEEFNLTSYPKIETDFDDIFGVMNPFSSIETEIKSALPQEFKIFLEASQSTENKEHRIQTRIPYSLNIK
ncbi:signal peptide peptidase SppA [Flavobacteriaceae bacterium]|uniref:signal peptide peptidase SppA n=1 Tax=Candidatus Arcticimaribacter forsetii TaxID=2820661 RepID=UPI0020770E8C|nr:signal peptide peptidase SppA [Candidatus Arcticimaribacter forsetii]MDA8699220.1 signal peptide peptidase SppA [Flavobacteriaceae bacterium]MDB2329269.1 signal peptide peptidase SppA [Flavobacteriaceae bacterium]